MKISYLSGIEKCNTLKNLDKRNIPDAPTILKEPVTSTFAVPQEIDYRFMKSPRRRLCNVSGDAETLMSKTGLILNLFTDLFLKKMENTEVYASVRGSEEKLGENWFR